MAGAFQGDFVKWFHVLVRRISVRNMENYSQKRFVQNKFRGAINTDVKNSIIEACHQIRGP